MLYRIVDCPTCGNEITISSNEMQKCKWCKRWFRVTIKRLNKIGKKAKLKWIVEAVD